MKKILITLSVMFTTLGGCLAGNIYQPRMKNELRAPAYPLVTVDPYTSGWSFSNNLYDETIKHWTGKKQQLIGVITVDNKAYRFMGEEQVPMKPIVPMAAYKPCCFAVILLKCRNSDLGNPIN